MSDFCLMNEFNDIPMPFESYFGEEPYVFVSYSHADKAMVYETMRFFRDAGVNLWYDEGIPPAGEWVEEIANAIKNSRLFLVFVTSKSVGSQFVRCEVGYALSEDKEILTVFLENTKLPSGLSLCLQQFQSISSSERNWRHKAIKTMLSKLETHHYFELEDVKAYDEVEIRYTSSQLWKHWDDVFDTQITKVENKKSCGIFKENDDKHKFISKKKDLYPIPSTSFYGSKNSKRKATSHPFASDVSVFEQESKSYSSTEKEHEDKNVGTLSWIPPGSISIRVPYSGEHKVIHLRNGFWLGKYLITQKVYHEIMGTNPSFTHNSEEPNNHNFPVNNLSWLDAVGFCKALTILNGNLGTLPALHEFRLPSEVEWEYACRAGTTTEYYFGDDWNNLSDHAWYRDNSGKQIHAVGLKKPNPWGLYDVYGNVREWVGNSFVNSLLENKELDEFRISRGGAYMKAAPECTSSVRFTNSLYHRFRNLGFRVALAKIERN